jgi:hypothetical protein
MLTQIAPLVADGLEIAVTPNGGVVLSGRMTSRAPAPEIQPYLRRIHEDARTKRLPKIEVDVTKLTFVNSSAIRLFVDWAMWVKEPTGAPYKLVFRTRDGVAWQRLTLTALKSIAPSAIEVEVEA